MFAGKVASLSGNRCCQLVQNQIFHHDRCIALKRVTSLQGPSSRHHAQATQLLLRNVAPVASLWQHCARFDRADI